MLINPLRFIKNNLDSLHLIVDLMPLPVFIKDVNGIYLTCNTAFEKLTGLTQQQITGKDVYDIWDKSQADIFFVKDKELFENPDVQDYETHVNTPSDTKHIINFHKKIFYDGDNKAAGYLCVLTDVTEKRMLEKLLSAQASTDELTQLANRREGLKQVTHVLYESARKNRHFCVAVLDIDNFKKINDTYGHAAGDNVLITIANTLKSALRNYDILFRYGGEEFVVCLPDTSIADGLVVFERMRLACESSETEIQSNKKLKVTISIGIAEHPTQGDTIQKLLECSDLALYQIKRSGKNGILYLSE
jgi:diguanylate cyclase (GGDEF)-like protein/PAS domain S-box-containing protein